MILFQFLAHFSNIAASNFGDDGIKYLCQCASSPFQKVLLGRVVEIKFPELVVLFFESKINFFDGTSGTLSRNILQSKQRYLLLFFFFFSGSSFWCPMFQCLIYFSFISATRSVQKQINDLGILLAPKVKVVRNFDLEIFLLKTPQNQPPQKRRHVPLRLNISNIPVGVRGRKRNTPHLLDIGIAPNPDNRKLTVPLRKFQPTQPAKRTYSRLQSTPFPYCAKSIDQAGKRTQTRLISAPLQPNHLLIDDDETAETVSTSNNVDIVDFDQDIGRLYYSDSDSE